MKNIQVIDGAENCVYDIFQISDDQFYVLFPNNEDIENKDTEERCKRIHGIIFFELENKKVYYPTRRDEEAINPGGSRLR